MNITAVRNTFKHYLINRFYSVSQSPLTQEELEYFIDYLIFRNVIPDRTAKIYSILAEFGNTIHTNPEKKKSECVKSLTIQFDLHEKTIWNILRDHKGKFNLQ